MGFPETPSRQIGELDVVIVRKAKKGEVSFKISMSFFACMQFENGKEET